MADGESTTEQWRTQLQNDLRNIFESFMTRWDKRLDEMFGEKDHVIVGKQEPEDMSCTGTEVQTNDFNQVMKEIVTVTEVKNKTQVPMKTKTAVVEEPLQVKKPVKLEEDGCQQVWLGDEKSDSVERQPVIDKIHIHQISNKTSNVIDDYEKFDGISSMMFVDKNVMVDDPYGFRLLVMGRSNGVVLFEPILVLDLESHQLQIFTHASELESSLSCLNVLVETYFAEVPVETYETLNSLKDVDPVNETKLDDVIKFSLVFAAQKVVGGIEAKVDISDQPMNMILPNVVGFKLLGKLGNGVTAIELNVNLPKKEIAQVTGDCELHIGTQFDGVYHVISWLVLFNWYDEKGTAHKSIGNFRKMLFSGLQIDVVPILNILALHSEFCKCHQVDCFHSYVRRSVMVTGYGILGRGKKPVRVFKQMVMSSTTTVILHKECGGSVDAILGYTLVVPENCEIACIGDGSFQVIGQDVITMLRCGQETIIFLINDAGYTIEVEIYDGPYNKIKSCNHIGLLDTIHNGQEKCWIAKVFREKELIEAIEKTTELNHGKSGCKEIGFKKKRNRKGKPVESFLRALAAIQFVTTATFLGYSKKNNKNITFSIIENLQPKHTSKLTRAAGMIDQSLTLVVKMSPLLSILNLYGIASGKGNHVDLSHCNNPFHVLDFIGAFELGNCWKGLNVMVVLIEVMKFKNACIAAKEKLSDDNQPTSTLSVNGKVALQKTQLGRLPISIMVFILEDKDVFKGRVFDMSQLAKSDHN